MPFGLNFGGSKSSSSQQSTFQDQIFAGQAPFLSSLFHGSQGIVDRFQPGMQNLFNVSGGLQDQGQQALGGLFGAGSGVTQPQFGEANINPFMTSTAIEAQLASLQNQAGKLFTETLQPAIASELGGAGQQAGLGRSRVGNAMAAGQVADAFMNQAGGVIGQGFAQQQQAAQFADQLGLQQAGLGLQAQLGAGGLGLQGNLGVLGGLGDLFNLGLAPFTSQLSMQGILADIIGPPTVLRQGQSSGSSSGKNFNIGFRF